MSFFIMERNQISYPHLQFLLSETPLFPLTRDNFIDINDYLLLLSVKHYTRSLYPLKPRS